MIDFGLLAPRQMNNLFMLSLMLLEFIDLNLDVGLELEQISLELDLNLMKRY